jgi:hypothetical protein
MAGKIFCELILNDLWRVVIFIALLTLNLKKGFKTPTYSY